MNTRSGGTILLGAIGIVAVAASVHGQTLDDLRHPLLNERQVLFSARYDRVALEYEAISIVADDVSFAHPYHILSPRMQIGLTPRLQLTLDGVWQMPLTFESPLIFGNSMNRDSNGILMLSPRLTFRMSPQLEFSGAYLSGRSEFEGDLFDGGLLSSRLLQTDTTHIVEVGGRWLPRRLPARETIQADFDGLDRPLLDRHGVQIEWWLTGRRTASTLSDDSAYSGWFEDELSATEVRAGGGGTFGLTTQLELAADAYWQAPFTVTRAFSGALIASVRDGSLRFETGFGARGSARWRPARTIEFSGVAAREVLPVTAPGAPADRVENAVYAAGLSWLSRPPSRVEPLAADLTGLLRPLLERHQLRIDASVEGRTARELAFNAVSTSLVQGGAALGVTDTVQAAFTAAVSESDPSFLSFGGTLVVRVARRVDLRLSGRYHQLSLIDRYPTCALRHADIFRPVVNFQAAPDGGDSNVAVSAAIIF